jgi:hypothetical protein
VTTSTIDPETKGSLPATPAVVTAQPLWCRTLAHGGGFDLNFALAADVKATVEVFDLQGRRVRTLADGMTAAGPHALRWDGRNESGRPCGSGVYFVRMRAGDRQEKVRAVLVR